MTEDNIALYYKQMSFEELKTCKELSTDINAQYELGVRYCYDEYNNRHDLKTGCKYLHKAMQGGHSEAVSKLEEILINARYTSYWIEYLFNFFFECYEKYGHWNESILFNCEQLIKAYKTEKDIFEKTVRIDFATCRQQVKVLDLYDIESFYAKYIEIRGEIRIKKREILQRQKKEAKNTTIKYSSILVIIVCAVAIFVNISVALRLLLVFVISFAPVLYVTLKEPSAEAFVDEQYGEEAVNAGVGCCVLTMLTYCWAIISFIVGMLMIFS